MKLHNGGKDYETDHWISDGGGYCWCRVMNNLFKILVIFLILFPGNLFGSKSYWNHRGGVGSKHHWENGVGLTFPDNPWVDICVGLISSGEDEPDICSMYPFVYEMVKSLK